MVSAPLSNEMESGLKREIGLGVFRRVEEDIRGEREEKKNLNAKREFESGGNVIRVLESERIVVRYEVGFLGLLRSELRSMRSTIRCVLV